MALSELSMAPFMPSNTARSGGTIYPIIKNIPEIFDSRPGETSRKMGAYLMWTGSRLSPSPAPCSSPANAPNLLGAGTREQDAQAEHLDGGSGSSESLPLAALLFLAVPSARLLALSTADQVQRGRGQMGLRKRW